MIRHKDNQPMQRIEREQKQEPKNEFFYRGKKLSGYTSESKTYTPREMFYVFEFYERMLKQKHFYEARIEEDEEKHPKEWLNQVISALIKEKGYKFNRDLIENFRDRGFSVEHLVQDID